MSNLNAIQVELWKDVDHHRLNLLIGSMPSHRLGRIRERPFFAARINGDVSNGDSRHKVGGNEMPSELR